jgi:hypothetical protein
MCEAPAYRIIPLNVAQHACESSQNARKTSRLSSFSRLRLSQLANSGFTLKVKI